MYNVFQTQRLKSATKGGKGLHNKKNQDKRCYLKCMAFLKVLKVHIQVNCSPNLRNIIKINAEKE